MAEMATRRRFIWSSFLLPGIAWLAVLFLIPLGLVVAMSFGTTNVIGQPVYAFHPGNYAQVFQPIFLPILERSVMYALVATAICFALGYAVAYTVAMFGGRYRNLIILFVILPWFVDYLVRIYAWVELLAQGGLISRALSSVGIGGKLGVQLLGGTPAVILGLVYNFLPFMILPVYVALEQMDRRLIEAGKDLYGSPRQTFFRVTLFATLQGVATGCVLVFLSAAGDFVTAQLLGGPGNYMIGNLISDETTGLASLPLGAGLTVVLMLLMALVVFAYMRVSRVETVSR
jgi:spermidine/putrescine transport system permease protein